MVRRSSYFDPKAIDKKMSEFTTKESRYTLKNLPLLRVPKIKYRDFGIKESLNLSAGESYQRSLTYFLSKGIHLTGEQVNSISFAGNKKIKAKNVLTIIERRPNTVYLDISNTSLKASDFKEKTFPNVRELTITGYKKEDLKLILNNFPHLTQINIVGDKILHRGEIAEILDEYDHIEHIRIFNSYATETDSKLGRLDKEDYFLEQFPLKRFYFDNTANNPELVHLLPSRLSHSAAAA